MDYTHWMDGELAQRLVVGGDDEPFRELVRRHGSMVLRTCRRVTSNPHDAEDAAQLVFAILCARAAELTTCRSFAGWLYNTAWQVGRRVQRSQARRWRYETRAARDRVDAAAAANGYADEDTLHELHRAIDMLPGEYCEAIVLHHLEGMTVQEVSELMACPPGTTAARLSRGRAIIRERLARRGIVLSAAMLEATFLAEAIRQESVRESTAFCLPSPDEIAALSNTVSVVTPHAIAGGGTAAVVALPVKSAGVFTIGTLLSARGWIAAACFAGVVTAGGSAAAYQCWLNRPTMVIFARGTASVDAKDTYKGYEASNSGSSSRGSVPEPSGLSLLGLGVLALRRRRRRQH